MLKQAFPDAHITVLINPINESIAQACTFIDYILLDIGQSTTTLGKELRQGDFDISFTLFSNTRVAIAQWLAHIPKRYAPATKLAQVFYNHRITQRRSQVRMAEFEYNINLILAAYPNINTSFPKPLLTFPEDKSAMVYQQFCQALNITKPVIAFHPGFGGSSDANWNVEEYIQLAQSIADKDIDIVFTFGPGDEVFLAEFEAKRGELQANVYQSHASVADFAKLLSHFKLFISTSTGTFHVASAVGTPTMTFFADSLFASAKRWKGIGDESLQHNYLLPQDEHARQHMFAKVKQDLKNII
jgi:ADP-heptose:LPS heptosyltransferase